MAHLRTCSAGLDEQPIATDACDAINRLRPLLAAVVALDLDDREGWIRLRHAAGVATNALSAAGALPEHLTVGVDDPPVLVSRTLAAAWRYATSAPERQGSR